jgi:predicted aconitase
VSFANAVLGARSNREGGPSALAAAICGCTPDHGLHRDEHRRPTVAVHVTARLDTRADFGALGSLVGQRVQDGRPYFTGLDHASTDDLKALGAAMAASGAVAMYHVEGLTPEAGGGPPEGGERFTVGEDDLRAAYARLNSDPGPSPSPDLVVLGCPHASLREVHEIAGKLAGRTLRRPVWVCTSRAVKDAATALGLTRTIEQAGGRVVADTCMVVAPIEQMGIATTAVDSGKAAAYLPGFCRQRVVFRDLDTLLAEAMS